MTSRATTTKTGLLLLAAACFLLQHGSANGECVQFWPNLCPGPSSCMCTTGHTCVAANTSAGGQGDVLEPPIWLIDKNGGCAGTCKTVTHGKCKGSNLCLWEGEPCGSGPSPSPPSPPSPPPPSPPSPPPPSSSPQGPDVSHYQGAVDWQRVANQGAGFGICKASEGSGYTDDQFAANWKGMRSAGIGVRGAYHFGHPGTSAADQAAHFVSVVGGTLSSGEFLVLDIEDATARAVANRTHPVAASNAVASWSADFVKAVMSKAGLPARRVWVYTGAWFWDPKAGGSDALADHPLWVSSYTSSPRLPSGWSNYAMWQYTDKASWSGVANPCDSSKFHGSQAELEALVS